MASPSVESCSYQGESNSCPATFVSGTSELNALDTSCLSPGGPRHVKKHCVFKPASLPHLEVGFTAELLGNGDGKSKSCDRDTGMMIQSICFHCPIHLGFAASSGGVSNSLPCFSAGSPVRGCVTGCRRVYPYGIAPMLFPVFEIPSQNQLVTFSQHRDQTHKHDEATEVCTGQDNDSGESGPLVRTSNQANECGVRVPIVQTCIDCEDPIVQTSTDKTTTETNKEATFLPHKESTLPTTITSAKPPLPTIITTSPKTALSSAGVCSENSFDVGGGSDIADERADNGTCCEAIHLPSDVTIHCAHDSHDSDTGSEYFTDSDDQYEADEETLGSVPNCSTSCGSRLRLDNHPPSFQDDAHLGVSPDCLRLRKLLSDESGYYDGGCSNVSDWCKRDGGLSCEDFGDWDDDDDDNTDGDAESDDECADTLWKSFEDCMLSPESLHIPSMKPKQTPPQRPAVTTATSAEAVWESELMQSGTRTSCTDTQQGKVRVQSSEEASQGGTESPLTTCTMKTCLCFPPDSSVSIESPVTVKCTHSPSISTESPVDTNSLQDSGISTKSPVAMKCVHSPQDSGISTKSPTAATKCVHESCTSTKSPTGKKSVHFPQDSSISAVHKIVAWKFAYQAARKGTWEQYARNRAHFRRRIENLASTLEPCLTKKLADIQN